MKNFFVEVIIKNLKQNQNFGRFKKHDIYMLFTCEFEIYKIIFRQPTNRRDSPQRQQCARREISRGQY